MALMMVSVFMFTTISWSAPSVYHVKISDDHAKVTQRWKGTSNKIMGTDPSQGVNSASEGSVPNKIIIHVQDAHANFSAQDHMARALCELIPQLMGTDPMQSGVAGGQGSVPTIPFIGIEGAIGEYDLNELRAYPVKDAKETVGAQGVKNGEFIGAEYANIISDNEFTLFGLEDEDLFKKDFQAFYTIASHAGELEGYLEELEEVLASLKEIVYVGDLKEFDTAATQYEQSTTGLLQYLPILYTSMDEADLELFDYINLVQFQDVFRVGQMVDQNLLKRQIAKLSEELNETGLNASYCDGTVAEHIIVKEFIAAAQKNNIDLNQYLEVQKSMTYWRGYALVNMEKLLNEVLEVNADIRRSLALTNNEARLVDLWQKMIVMRQLFGLKALRETIETYEADKAGYQCKTIASDIELMAQSVGLGISLRSPDIDIDALIESVENFYDYAEDRDVAMLDNLLEQMDAQGQQVGVLVAGGYHSEGIMNLMKAQGLSFVTVQPQIDNMLEDVAYMDRMMGGIVPVSPMLSSHFQMSRLTAGLKSFMSISEYKDFIDQTYRDIAGASFLVDTDEKAQAVINAVRVKDERLADAMNAIWFKGLAQKISQTAQKASADEKNGSLTAVSKSWRETGELFEKYGKFNDFNQAMASAIFGEVGIDIAGKHNLRSGTLNSATDVGKGLVQDGKSEIMHEGIEAAVDLGSALERMGDAAKYDKTVDVKSVLPVIFYDATVETGFSEDEARAMLDVATPKLNKVVFQPASKKAIEAAIDQELDIFFVGTNRSAEEIYAEIGVNINMNQDKYLDKEIRDVLAPKVQVRMEPNDVIKAEDKKFIRALGVQFFGQVIVGMKAAAVTNPGTAIDLQAIFPNWAGMSPDLRTKIMDQLVGVARMRQVSVAA